MFVRSFRLLVLAVIATLAALVVPATASAATPYCGITWGSLAKTGTSPYPAAGALLTGVRAGQQACYDRLVIDIKGTTSMRSWRVEYVPQVTMDGSGFPVPLRGGAFLQISFGASDHDAAGRLSYVPANRRELVDVAGYPVFRQVAWAGSFEGVTTLGLGVRARLPFRAFTLPGIPGSANGTRLVVDVARAW